MNGNRPSLTVTTPPPSRKLFQDTNLEFATGDKTVSEITVTRERCIDPTLVDSFLRQLRHSSDDIIRQKLNNYSKKGSTNKDKLDACNTFVKDELYPNWKARNDIINFCATEAKQLKVELDSRSENSDTLKKAKVDLRLDPYANRDAKEEQEARYSEWKRMDQWVKNNLNIESILQHNSDKILKQKCDENEEYLNKFWTYIRNK